MGDRERRIQERALDAAAKQGRARHRALEGGGSVFVQPDATSADDMASKPRKPREAIEPDRPSDRGEGDGADHSDKAAAFNQTLSAPELGERPESVKSGSRGR
jgi:hypothetical protein